MTQAEIEQLPTDQLDALVFSDRWKFAVWVMGAAIVLILVAIAGLYVLRSNDNADRARRDAQASVDDADRLCQQSNVSRSDQRDVLDFIANPTPFDLNALPEDAVAREPLLVGALKIQQRKAHDFREAHLDAWAPRDCPRERAAAMKARGLTDPG